jgi:hypothetical protein
MIGRAGAELILHGHNHVGSVAFLPGPDGAGVPIVGGPSASARPGSHEGMPGRRAAYYLYAFTQGEGGRHAITGLRRGLNGDGTVTDLGPLSLTRD